MYWLWTWSGKCFGYLDGNDLWTYDGKHVGKCRDDQIYDNFGRYLGEIMDEDRLIKDNDRSLWTNFAFSLLAPRPDQEKQSDKTGHTMKDGYSEFPDPDDFE